MQHEILENVLKMHEVNGRNATASAFIRISIIEKGHYFIHSIMENYSLIVGTMKTYTTLLFELSVRLYLDTKNTCRYLQVDVIVNTTSSDLNLTSNASARALSDAAGPMLQQECKAIGNVNTGDIVVTSGANLKCKHVFHTSCPGWNQQSGEKVQNNIVIHCDLVILMLIFSLALRVLLRVSHFHSGFMHLSLEGSFFKIQLQLLEEPAMFIL